MTNILHIATTDIGGAGTAAYRLHRTLQKTGFNSILIVFNKKRNDKSIIQFSFKLMNLAKKAKRKILYEFRRNRQSLLVEKYNFLNYSEIANYLPTSQLLAQIKFKPDIIVIHWVTHFINARNIQELYKATGAKIYWNLMDMASMTGGCHYAWDCTGYMNVCGECPALKSKSDRTVARNNFLYKEKYLKKLPLTIIAPASTLLLQAQKSTLFGQKIIKKILLPINENDFDIGNKIEARERFNLPKHSKVIFAGAQHINEERKGFAYFIAALNYLKKDFPEKFTKKLIILLAGKQNEQIQLPFNTKFVGYLTEKQLIKAYQAADVFLSTSVEDSGPVMINESIMTGTPVVAFDMGVAPDLVITKETGYRARLMDAKDLSKGLSYVLGLQKQEYYEMCQKCRETALNQYSVQQYNMNFSNILNYAI